jgi:hypothetical protein
MASTSGLLSKSLAPLVLGCPACGAKLPAPLADGSQICRACRIVFDCVVFDPPKERGVVVMPSTAGTPCAQHARNLATGSCTRCGAFMCELCKIDCDSHQVCPTCFERLQQEGALPSLRTRIVNYNNIAFTIALVGVPFMAVGLLIGPIVIFYATRGLRQNRALDEDSFQARGVIAIILGVIELGVGFCMLLVMLGAIGSHR